MTKVRMVCSYCGSEDVSKDAWADWDVDRQEWVLRTEFDNAHCHNCDGETSLTELELTEQVE